MASTTNSVPTVAPDAKKARAPRPPRQPTLSHRGFWENKTKYAVNMMATSNKQQFRVIAEHKASIENRPGVTDPKDAKVGKDSAQFWTLVTKRGAWATATDFKVNDVVTFEVPVVVKPTTKAPKPRVAVPAGSDPNKPVKPKTTRHTFLCQVDHTSDDSNRPSLTQTVEWIEVVKKQRARREEHYDNFIFDIYKSQNRVPKRDDKKAIMKDEKTGETIYTCMKITRPAVSAVGEVVANVLHQLSSAASGFHTNARGKGSKTLGLRSVDSAVELVFGPTELQKNAREFATERINKYLALDTANRKTRAEAKKAAKAAAASSSTTETTETQASVATPVAESIVEDSGDFDEEDDE